MSVEAMLKKAEKFGEAEIVVDKVRYIRVMYTNDKIELSRFSRSENIYLRLVKRGRIVQTSFTNEHMFPKALKSAVSMLRFAKPVKGYHLPDKADYQKAKTWSKDLENIEISDMTNYTLDGIDGISSVGARPMGGRVSLVFSTTQIVNSRGVDFLEYSNNISAYFSAISGTGTGYDFWSSGLLDFDPRDLGESAGKMALENERARKEAWNGKVVLHPDVIDDFVSLILKSVNGNRVRKKSSPWVGKLGKNVLGKVTIVEDPWIPYFPSTSRADDEGVPTRKKTIIDQGVLRTFLYDTVTAARVGKESTGNGFRSGGEVSVDVTNVVVDFEKREDMDGWDNYLLVHSLMGFHNANSRTGAFSLTLDHGVVRKNGEEIPVKGGLFIGNMYDLFSNVALASSVDYRRGDMITPYLMTHGRLVV